MPYKITIVELALLPDPKSATVADLPMPIEILSMRLEALDLHHVIQTLTKKPRARRSDAGKPKVKAVNGL
jgi:hypothetical protein